MSEITDAYKHDIAFAESYVKRVLTVALGAFTELEKQKRPECLANLGELIGALEVAHAELQAADQICKYFVQILYITSNRHTK